MAQMKTDKRREALHFDIDPRTNVVKIRVHLRHRWRPFSIERRVARSGVTSFIPEVIKNLKKALARQKRTG